MSRRRSRGRFSIVAALVGAALIVAALTQTAGAAPSARIAGTLQVGKLVRVAPTGGAATAVRWQRCRTRVVRQRCATMVRVGAGRTHRIARASAGRSLRAVMRIRGKRVATRWSAPVRPAPAAPGAPTTPPTAQGALVIPGGWQITGSAATIALDPALSPAERDTRLRDLSATYARIDDLTRNRALSYTAPPDSEGKYVDVTLHLCAPRGTFLEEVRITWPGDLGSQRFDVDGEWTMRLDLTAPTPTPMPTLTLAYAEDQPTTDPVTLDPSDPTRVVIGAFGRASAPSAHCASR
jgi:hypothetical protein